jgi:glyoxylase-like metal-dependent hydrolase (beta-lactamase superfamily II)
MVSIERTIPAVTDLGAGIAQIRLPMVGNPLRYINGYLLEDAGGLTLVDCGWRAADVLATLNAGLRELGYTIADVRRVLITHHHFDHYGLAGTLRRAGVPQLLMHARDWERVESFRRHLGDSDREADLWLERNGFVPGPLGDDGFAQRFEIAEPTRLIEDGERIGRLEAVWTPGHSPGHLCFADVRSGRMLTGDHVLDPITPHLGMWRETDRDPVGSYLRSLAKVRAYGAVGALPAHGEPFADLARRVEELIDHTAGRDAQVLAVVRAAGPVSAGDVARRLPWTRRNRSFADLGEFHQQFAVSETIAHLHHLRAGDRVVREDGPDPIRYAAGGGAD